MCGLGSRAWLGVDRAFLAGTCLSMLGDNDIEFLAHGVLQRSHLFGLSSRKKRCIT